jgi:LPS export ABC transporter protein LptC
MGIESMGTLLKHMNRVRRCRRVSAVAVGVVMFGAMACGDGSDAVAGAHFSDLPADQVVFDLDTDIKDLGVLRARLHADTAHIWEDSAKWLMFPVSVRLYDDNGGQTAHLTAMEGELDSRTNAMVARGNVVLIADEGNRRILTEELHYDPSSGRIWSDVPTVMYEGEARLEGQGFRADDQMRDVEVFKSVGDNIPLRR